MKNGIFGLRETRNRLLNQRHGHRRQILSAVTGILALLVASTEAQTVSDGNTKFIGKTDASVASTSRSDAANSSGVRGKGFLTVYPRFGSRRAKWRKIGNSLKLSIPQIRNLSFTRTTGTLRVYLIAGKSTAVYRGSGRVLGFKQYSYVLPPNYYFRAQRTRVRLLRQPRSWVRTAMVLGEFNGFGYTIRDIIRFPGKVRFRR